MWNLDVKWELLGRGKVLKERNTQTLFVARERTLALSVTHVPPAWLGAGCLGSSIEKTTAFF